MDSVEDMRMGKKIVTVARNKMLEEPKIGFISYSIIVITLVFFPSGYHASQITWKPNLEWNHDTNWADNVLPKNGSHVVFPVEMRLSVGLPFQQDAAMDIAGIELPRDGVIALPRKGILTISQASPTSKTVTWSREGPLLWVEPNNWISERSSEAVPHLERIPCQDDTVVLPDVKRIVSIQSPDTFGTTVQAVRVTGDTGNLPPWEWQAVSTQRDFYARPMSVGYTGRLRSCIDCTCQTEETGRKLLAEVCRTPGATCATLGCNFPINVEGHCCFYCGGRVLIPDDTSLSKTKLVSKLALESYESTISYYARKTWDSKMEILVAGKTEYSTKNTLEAVNVLAAALEEQGIKVLSIETTGGEVTSSKLVAVTGPFFGSLLIAIVLLLVAFPYFGYSLPQVLGDGWRGLRDVVNNRKTDAVVAAPMLSGRPFGFAKFENATDGEVELAAAALPSSGKLARVSGHDVVTDEEYDDDDVDGDGNGRGEFANPLYRSVRRTPEAQSFSALKKLQDDVVGADEEIDLSIP